MAGRTAHLALTPQPGPVRRAHPARRPAAGSDPAPASPRQQAGTPVTRTLPDRPPTAAGLPRHRAIVAVDIEQSTSRPDTVKADLRRPLYDPVGQALRSAGIHRPHPDPFTHRGGGPLAR